MGKRSFNKGLANFEIKFTADKAVFKLSADSGDSDVVEMKYNFSKSPLVLEYKASKGKSAKIHSITAVSFFPAAGLYLL